MRRAVTAVLAPFWLVGFCAGGLLVLGQWAWAAAADGYHHSVAWKWAPALGAGLLALTAGLAVALW